MRKKVSNDLKITSTPFVVFFRKMKIFPNADGGLGSNKIAIIALFFSQPV